MTDKQYYFSQQITNNRIILDEQESRHCTRVMRHRIGDRIDVLDGKGNLYHTIIQEVKGKNAILALRSCEQEEKFRDFHIHVAIGPTKNMNRFEVFLEKVVEIGIDEITPVVSSNSERREVKTERIRKILVAALKQSGQRFLPEVHPTTPFALFVKRELPADKFIAHCLEPDLPLLVTRSFSSAQVTLLIGPEGGYIPEEVNLALTHGFMPVSLGNNRLRTETAGIVAVTAVHHHFMYHPSGPQTSSF